jgi:chromate transporter
MATPETTLVPPHRVRRIVGYFLRLGTLGFGGPVALVGLMDKELVHDRGWLSREEMRNAIAVSQSLPGPLAIQVGIFIAYLRGGFWGAWAGGWAISGNSAGNSSAANEARPLGTRIYCLPSTA